MRKSQVRSAQVRAFAKINLDLRVLNKRVDGYHELRTIFQTISLADVLDISFKPWRTTSVICQDTWNIPNNLAERAANLVMSMRGAKGRVEIRIDKRIPMGAGLGGGSSDAAAVLLALPVLSGRSYDVSTIREMGEDLGSDVPFFLLGGTAVGIGRGTELFPMSDAPPSPGILVAPDVHVSTSEAYRSLMDLVLTQESKVARFQSVAWGGDEPRANDFEEVVFKKHKELAAIKKRLQTAGATQVLMTGSGSSIFGLFSDRAKLAEAYEELGELKRFRISMVSRSRYRSMWMRSLAEYATPGTWPPAA